MGAESDHQNQFPPELEREIFEIAAALDYRSVPRLMRVARRVREWVEPELYRVIRSGLDDEVVPWFYIRNPQQTFGQLKPDLPFIEGFGMHVHHVLLQSRTSEEIGQILERCPNVTNLAVWMIYGSGVSGASLIPIIGSLKSLRRLSFDPSCFFETDGDALSTPFEHSMFRNLTHLRLINTAYSWVKRKLAVMPALTHLALSGMVERQLLDFTPGECKRLELLVVLYLDDWTHDNFALKQPPTDPRVVLIVMNMNQIDHAEQGARGKEDFWITGERVKQERIERRKSAIAPTSEMTG